MRFPAGHRGTRTYTFNHGVSFSSQRNVSFKCMQNGLKKGNAPVDMVFHWWETQVWRWESSQSVILLCGVRFGGEPEKKKKKHFIANTMKNPTVWFAYLIEKVFSQCEGDTLVPLIKVIFCQKISQTCPLTGLKGGYEKFFLFKLTFVQF